MAPFTGNGVGAGQNLSIDDNPTANTGAENYPKDNGCALSGTVDRLRKRETVGIIGKANLALQQGLQALGASWQLPD